MPGLRINYNEQHFGISSAKTAHQKDRLVPLTIILTEETGYRS